MATGRRPFAGKTPAAVLQGIVRDTPERARQMDREVPAALDGVIARCLQKEPGRRYDGAQELLEDLRKARGAPAGRGRSWKLAAAGVALAAILAGAGWWTRRNAKIRWAEETALPRIVQLAEAENYFPAAALAREAAQVLPTNQILKRLWPRLTWAVTVESTPDGAEVYRKAYEDVKGGWEHLGRTPLKNIRIARGYGRWKLVKAGHETLEAGGDGSESASHTTGFAVDPGVGAGYANDHRVPAAEERRGAGGDGGGGRRIDGPANSGAGGNPADRHSRLPDRPLRGDEPGVQEVRGCRRVREAGVLEAGVREGRADAGVAGGDGAVAGRHRAAGAVDVGVEQLPGGAGRHPVTGSVGMRPRHTRRIVHKKLPTAYHWSRAAGTRMGPWRFR